jgi:hypothetical protein
MGRDVESSEKSLGYVVVMVLLIQPVRIDEVLVGYCVRLW